MRQLTRIRLLLLLVPLACAIPFEEGNRRASDGLVGRWESTSSRHRFRFEGDGSFSGHPIKVLKESYYDKALPDTDHVLRILPPAEPQVGTYRISRLQTRHGYDAEKLERILRSRGLDNLDRFRTLLLEFDDDPERYAVAVSSDGRRVILIKPLDSRYPFRDPMLLEPDNPREVERP